MLIRGKDPSLHVKKSDLKKILIKVIGCDEKQAESYSIKMLKEGVLYTPVNRVIIPAKTKSVKKVSNSTEVLAIKVKKFKQYLDILRGPYSVRNINESSREYTVLTEAAINAYEYANIYYPFNEEDGIIEFIKTGLRIIKKFTLQSLSSYKESIYAIGNNIKEIREKDDASLTRKFVALWNAKTVIDNRANPNYENPEDYICFMYARIQADELKAKYENWIDAQIDALSFASVKPKLTQLYGDKALNNYNDFLFKKKKKEGDTTVKTGGLLSKLSKLS